MITCWNSQFIISVSYLFAPIQVRKKKLNKSETIVFGLIKIR
jgi:hypothetical protein